MASIINSIHELVLPIVINDSTYFHSSISSITKTRAYFIEKILLAKIPKIIQNRNVIHVVLVVTTLLNMIYVFAAARGISLFSLHPICIILGLFLFLAEGILVARNRVILELLSPIMQADKRGKKARILHWLFQTLGSAFLTIGLLFILIHKIELGKTVIPHTIHSISGSIALLLILIQASVGSKKLENIDENNVRTFNWHGELGLITLDLLIFTAILGSLSFLSAPLVPVTSMIISWICIYIDYTVNDVKSGISGGEQLDGLEADFNINRSISD